MAGYQVQYPKPQSLNLGPLQNAMQQAAMQRMQIMQLQAMQQQNATANEQKALAGPNYDLGQVAPNMPTLKGVIGDSGEALNAAKEARATKLLESKSIPMSYLFPGRPGNLDSEAAAKIWAQERGDWTKLQQDYEGRYESLANMAGLAENLLNNPKAKELFGGIGAGALMQMAPEYASVRADLDKFKAAAQANAKKQVGPLGAVSEGEWKLLGDLGGKLNFAMPWEDASKRIQEALAMRTKALENAERMADPYSVQTQDIAKKYFEGLRSKMKGPDKKDPQNMLMERLKNLSPEKQARLLELFEKAQQ